MRGLPSLLAIAIALAACKNAEQQQQIEDNAKKLTADSKTDATAPIVDDNYKFRLGWPGAGWKLMGPAEAAAIHPDASAGAVFSDIAVVTVVVESVPGASLDAYAELVVGNAKSMVAELSVESRETLTFAGEPAVRLTWTGTLNGLQHRWIATVFVHDGHGYQIIGWGPPAKLQVAQLAPLLDLFSLLEGKVSGPPVVSLADRDGPGWRLTGGVFESAVSGIRIAPPSGWRISNPASVAAASADAEVGMEAPGVGGFVLLTPERIGKRAASTYAASMLAVAESSLGGKRTGTWNATLFGEKTELTVFDAAPLEFLFATHVVGDYGIQTVVTYPIAARDAAREKVTAALAGITSLDADARAQVRTVLESRKDPQHHVGAKHVLRGGVLRDFDAAIRWTKPPGFWTLRGDDDLSTPSVEKLRFSSLENGISGRLVSEPRSDGDAEAFHTERVGALGGTTGPKTIVPIASGTADVTSVFRDVGDLRIRTDVATVLHKGWAVTLEVSGHDEQMESAAKDVAAIFAGLETTQGFPMTRMIDRQYIDARLGFAIETPLFDWTHSDRTPPDRTAIGSNIVFESGRAKLGVVAFITADATDPEMIRSIAEQGAREDLTKRIGPATDGEATLAGEKARKTTWSAGLNRAEMISAVIGGVVFVLIAENVEAKDLEKMLGSFRVLE